MTHWYEPVAPTCSDCGEPPNAASHKRHCTTVGGSHRPGFGWCRLERGHAVPHEFVWWDGTVTRRPQLGGDEEILEEGHTPLAHEEVQT